MGADVKDTGKGGGKCEGVGDFFKVVVQAVLLFGSETWLLNHHMVWMLGGFQHRVSRRTIRKICGGYLTEDGSTPPLGGSDAGGWDGVSGGINNAEEECNHTVYFNTAYSGPM